MTSAIRTRSALTERSLDIQRDTAKATAVAMVISSTAARARRLHERDAATGRSCADVVRIGVVAELGAGTSAEKQGACQYGSRTKSASCPVFGVSAAVRTASADRGASGSAL